MVHEQPSPSTPADLKQKRRKLRIAILLLALSGVSLWASAGITKHTLWSKWRKPLKIAVVLLGPGGVSVAKKQLIADRLPKLDEIFAREFVRYRPQGLTAPVHFELAGAVGVEAPPPLPPDDGNFIGRVKHIYRLSRYLGEVAKRGELKLSTYDARIYVMLEPAKRTDLRFVEGVGERNGDVGLITTQLDFETLDLTLLAVGHEFLHCVGASDKYDADGHTAEPDFLPEPLRQPLYPQHFAEIMVGEITRSPTDGRLPDALDEVAIGPATAREVGWLKAGEPAPAVAEKSATR